MKKLIIPIVATLMTASLYWLFFHFVVFDFLAEKSNPIGQTESFEKIDALIQNSDFTRSELKTYLQADEYQNLEGQSKGIAGSIFWLTCFTVAIYSGIKFAITKLIPNQSTHSITGSAGSE